MRESFINRANKKHSNFYDYSKVQYIACKQKVIIICPKHGEFRQTPGNHMMGQGCKQCGIARRAKSHLYTTDIFINKAKKIHGNKYDYSGVFYKKSNLKIEIACKEHGSFSQTANDHLSGYGCKQCAIESNIERHTMSTEDFIKKAKVKYGNKYNYSKSIYKGCRKNIIITCPEHGDFTILAYRHLSKIGCYKCNMENYRKLRSSNSEEFVLKAKKLYGDKYNYSLVGYIHSKLCVKIICKSHGEFLQKPNVHLNGSGCRYCNESKGERKVAAFLQENNFKYKREKTFPRCIYKNKLKFDFYLPDQNICIEYDGEQHFIDGIFAQCSLEKIQIRDSIKNKFCEKNNILLIRIPYTEFNNIEDILRGVLCSS